GGDTAKPTPAWREFGDTIPDRRGPASSSRAGRPRRARLATPPTLTNHRRSRPRRSPSGAASFPVLVEKRRRHPPSKFSQRYLNYREIADIWRVSSCSKISTRSARFQANGRRFREIALVFGVWCLVFSV